MGLPQHQGLLQLMPWGRRSIREACAAQELQNTICVTTAGGNMDQWLCRRELPCF